MRRRTETRCTGVNEQGQKKNGSAGRKRKAVQRKRILIKRVAAIVSGEEGELEIGKQECKKRGSKGN